MQYYASSYQCLQLNDIITFEMYWVEWTTTGVVVGGGGGGMILSLNIYVFFGQRLDPMGFKDFSSPCLHCLFK